jgi:hypothetical protein
MRHGVVTSPTGKLLLAMSTPTKGYCDIKSRKRFVIPSFPRINSIPIMTRMSMGSDVLQVDNFPLPAPQMLHSALRAVRLSAPCPIVTFYPSLNLLLKPVLQDLPNDTNSDKHTKTCENDITGQSRAVCMLLIRGRIRRGWY